MPAANCDEVGYQDHYRFTWMAMDVCNNMDMITVNIYVVDTLKGQAEQALVAMLRQAYSD